MKKSKFDWKEFGWDVAIILSILLVLGLIALGIFELVSWLHFLWK